MKTLKYILPVFVFIALFFVNCNKHDCDKPTEPELTDAIITGTDYRKCSCCGGLMITFSNDPKPYSADFYIIGQMPKNTGIDDKTEFPVNVKVKYLKSTAGCGNFVDISILKRK